MLAISKISIGPDGTLCRDVQQFQIGEMTGLNFLWSLRKELDKRPEFEVEVYADGDELEFVLSRIKNLPHAGYSTTWRGEFARFIVDNLRV